MSLFSPHDYAIGLDIGGTKIAGAVYNAQGEELGQFIQPTPNNYKDFLSACLNIVTKLDDTCQSKPPIGVSVSGVLDRQKGIMDSIASRPSLYVFDALLDYLCQKPLRDDLARVFGRETWIENDANCAAYAEAVDGAGKGYGTVAGLIMGTGVAIGFVCGGHIVSGINGLCGEIGHLPLPYYVPEDGPLLQCGCGQKGCIEQLINGAGLSRLHTMMTGQSLDTRQIAAAAHNGEAEALAVLDRYYTVVAKAMVTVIHSFDPEIIVVSGGLNSLPGLYEKVPERIPLYALAKKPKTKFVKAKYGALSGVRGAALLVRQD